LVDGAVLAPENRDLWALMRTCHGIPPLLRRGHVTPPSAGRNPAFRWQSSFHDHIIRDRDEFMRHVVYIERQWIKHGLGLNTWCFIADECDGFSFG
jgi:hypothetical protein